MTRLLLSLSLLLVGCVAPEAVTQCDRQAELCHANALDASLTLEHRQSEADNERAWRQQRVSLTGDPVPGSESWAPLPPELAPVGPAPGGGR